VFVHIIVQWSHHKLMECHEVTLTVNAKLYKTYIAVILQTRTRE
jgi:hypothetical protein